MRKFWQVLLLAVTGLALIILSPPVTGHAKELSVTGLDAASAVIKDSRGKVYSHTAVLPTDKEFSVNYKFTIPNATPVTVGDTMTFYVPANVRVHYDEVFQIKDPLGRPLADCFIGEGASSGTATVVSNHMSQMTYRRGYLNIDAMGAGPTKPVTPPVATDPIAMTKSVSWADPENQSKLNWQLNLKSNGNELVNPVIVDQLSSNQTFVPNSTDAVTASGKVLPVTTVQNGSQLTFSLRSTLKEDFKLTYQTTTNQTKTRSEFTNSAVYHDDNDNNASANAKIDREDETTEEPEPIDMTKAATWADPDNQTKINWKLAVAANDNELINPTIIDKMSPNQTYVDGSAQAVDGNGKSVGVTASTAGTEIEFKFAPGTYTTDLHLTYQTTTDEPEGEGTFDNVAAYEDHSGNSATAKAEISREGNPVGPEIPGQKEPVKMAKTAAWTDPNDFSKINWTLSIAANGNQLVDPTIVDTLSNNHSYLADSAKVVDASGQPVPFTVSTVGKVITFKLTGTYTSDLKVSYQTTTDNPDGTETFENSAVYTDNNGNTADAKTSIDRKGQIVEPQKDPIDMSKTVAWSDPNDRTKLNWGLTVEANGNKLVNPRIVDEFTNNQTYVDGSVKAFTTSGTAIPVTATVNGSELSLKLTGTFTENIQITYQTKTLAPSGEAIFDNAAIYEDDADNNAAADATIERDAIVEPENPAIDLTKTANWLEPKSSNLIEWTIKIGANGNKLLNPKITDQLSPDLTYVEGSAKVVDSAGNTLPVNVNVTGDKVVFTLNGNFTNDFTLTYRTKASGKSTTFANAAIYEDDNGNGGSGSAVIDRPEVPGKPGPENPGPGKPGVTNPGKPGPENPGPGKPGVTNPGKPGPENPGPGKPGVTNPGQPSVTGPSTPGTTAPVQPGTTAPTTPSQPTSPTAPAVTTPATPSAPATSQTPVYPTPNTGTLPQTSEQHSSLGLLIGLISLLLSILAGYFSFRRHAQA